MSNVDLAYIYKSVLLLHLTTIPIHSFEQLHNTVSFSNNIPTNPPIDH